jgi:hypothetical protein
MRSSSSQHCASHALDSHVTLPVLTRTFAWSRSHRRARHQRWCRSHLLAATSATCCIPQHMRYTSSHLISLLICACFVAANCRVALLALPSSPATLPRGPLCQQRSPSSTRIPHRARTAVPKPARKPGTLLSCSRGARRISCRAVLRLCAVSWQPWSVWLAAGTGNELGGECSQWRAAGLRAAGPRGWHELSGAGGQAQ